MKQLIKGTQDTMKIKVVFKKDGSSIEVVYNEFTQDNVNYITKVLNMGYSMSVTLQ